MAAGAPEGFSAWLVCPACKGDLDESESLLRCAKCDLDYPIEDGIPVLLPPAREGAEAADDAAPSKDGGIAAWQRRQS